MKYHLGSGRDIREGYCNVDLTSPVADVRADIRTMTYERCDEILARHVWEHLGYAESMAVLIKWTLALNLHGKLIVDLPDPKAILEAAFNGDVKTQASAMRLLYGSQEAVWATHVNGWTPQWLARVLEDLGYSVVNVQHSQVGGPLFPNCAFETTAMKEQEHCREELIHRGQILLGYYCHSSETILHQHYCTQMARYV